MKNNSCDTYNHFYISDKYSSDDWDRMEDWPCKLDKKASENARVSWISC